MNRLTREQKTFIGVTRAYTMEHPHVSFQFSFDGAEQSIIGDGSKIIKVSFLKADHLFKRIFHEGNMGLGEGYSEGLIQVRDEDYKELLLVFVYATSPRIFRKFPLLDIIAISKGRIAAYFRKARKGATIDNHYSLSDWFDNSEDSNKFFLYWLTDDYHMYSCGKWDEGTRSLDEAQINKLKFYANRLGINENCRGKTLLDLGCGWGGVLFFMAEQYGVRCKGLTLSRAQYVYILKEIERRNLQELVSVELKDLFDMEGNYDYIISIGVLEHINRYHDLYTKIAATLNPHGRALIHSMHTNSIFYTGDPWLLKYIFPYGASPHFPTNMRRLKEHFRLVDANTLPPLSYPKTLDCWFANFCKTEPQIRELLSKNSKVKDIDFAIRTFKHYLAIASASLTNSGFVANILLEEPRL
jgi:cyclopropane-fatty-acyl-phospholipid synthase